MAYKELKTKHLQNYRSAKNYPVFLTNNTMKKLSETLTELGIAFSFPIEIKDANGKRTYYEYSNGCCWNGEYNCKGNETYHEDGKGYWFKLEYDSNGNETYYENGTGYWYKREYDANGNRTYFENIYGNWYKYEYDSNGNQTYHENSDGTKRGTPKSAKTCEGKVVEVDGIKYELKAL